MTGQVDDTTSGASYGHNIRFHDNTYRLTSPDAEAFAWQGAAWDPLTWQQRFAQDASSTFTTGRVAGRSATLAEHGRVGLG